MTTGTDMKHPAMGKLFRWGKYVLIAAIIVMLVYWARFTWNHRSNTDPKAPFRMKPSEGPGKLVQIGA
jgi:hypothetical protein